MNLDNLFKFAQLVGPFILAGFATLVLLKDRSQRQEKDTDKVGDAIEKLSTAISILNVTNERQAVLQKVTNDAITSMLNKLEHLEEKVQIHTTKIAILEEKEK